MSIAAEKELMTKLRTTIPFGDMRTVLSHTTAMRIIKYFPSDSNQSRQKLLCYNRYSEIVYVADFTYLSASLLLSLLPKRVSLIIDYAYMVRKKDFDRYSEKDYK